MTTPLSDVFPDLVKNLKLGWLLTGPIEVAASRLHGWLIDDFFALSGFNSEVLWAADGYSHHLKFTEEFVDELTDADVNVLMLQGVRSINIEDYFFDQCYRSGIKVVLLDCDNVNVKLGSRCDAVIVVSEHLKSLFSSEMQEKVFVAVDHYDHDASQVKVQTDKKELQMCFLSSNVFNKFPGLETLPSNTSLRIIGPPKKRVKKYTPHKKLFTQTPFEFEYINWGLETVEDNILDCDIALIPYPVESFDADYIKCKSNNRLVLFMSYGIPCIVSPVEPYLNTIVHGENGFFATTPDDWEKYVTLLRDDPSLRKKIAETARSQVLEKYAIYEQAKQYLEAISKAF